MCVVRFATWKWTYIFRCESKLFVTAKTAKEKRAESAKGFGMIDLGSVHMAKTNIPPPNRSAILSVFIIPNLTSLNLYFSSCKKMALLLLKPHKKQNSFVVHLCAGREKIPDSAEG